MGRGSPLHDEFLVTLKKHPELPAVLWTVREEFWQIPQRVILILATNSTKRKLEPLALLLLCVGLSSEIGERRLADHPVTRKTSAAFDVPTSKPSVFPTRSPSFSLVDLGRPTPSPTRSPTYSPSFSPTFSPFVLPRPPTP